MQQPLPSVLQTASSWRGGREARCFRASAHAWRCHSMAASDLGPKALNVAALNDLCHLCPTWTQAGCALNAVSREVSKLAANVRRRRRRKLLALRNEIRRHTFVTLRTVKGECSCWWKIHGVRDETVAVCAEIIHVKSHFSRVSQDFTRSVQRRSFSSAWRCVMTGTASASSWCL